MNQEEINTTIQETKIVLTLNQDKLQAFVDTLGWTLEVKDGKVIIVTDILAK